MRFPRNHHTPMKELQQFLLSPHTFVCKWDGGEFVSHHASRSGAVDALISSSREHRGPNISRSIMLTRNYRA